MKGVFYDFAESKIYFALCSYETRFSLFESKVSKILLCCEK